jgi:hypothetical protein
MLHSLALALLLPLCLNALPLHYQARLLNPIGSETPEGSSFAARLIGPLHRSHSPRLPRGITIHGHVLRSNSIGLGFRHEQAQLEIAWDGCRTESGDGFPCSIELAHVDNARETSPRPNLIRGVVAASHPHCWVSGVWFRPTPTLFGRSALGLTGAGGMLQARLFGTPIGAAAVVIPRLAFNRLPEPEIILPTGSDLIVRIATDAPLLEPIAPDSPLDPTLSEALLSRPAEVLHPDKSRAADLINFAFEASLEELQQSFRAAGWSVAEPLTARSFGRLYKAFSAMRTYESAPVSLMFLDGKAPDIVFQKSFNTLAKRHHIRLWRTELDGRTIWLGAATHDIGIAFDWSRFSVTHKVDRRIDRERNYLINDLTEANAIASLSHLPRPHLRATPKDAQPRLTDGRLAIIRLRTCPEPEQLELTHSRLKHNRFRLTARRVVLETRHYVTRGNPYYYAFRGIKMLASRRTDNSADD